jgi:hypothetical protein
VSSKRKKQAEAAARSAARSDEMIRAAGGIPHHEIDAELKQIRHERLVHNDDEIRAFRTEEVEFFSSRYGRHFNDGITELPRDLETRGFPALVSIKAYRSNWAIYDLEPEDDLVLEYHIDYLDGFVPKQIDMSAHEAALRIHNGELRGTGFNDVENLAFNLIGVCLGRNLTGFASLVQNEMQRRLPDIADAEIQAAYGRAHDEWLEVYSK